MVNRSVYRGDKITLKYFDEIIDKKQKGE